MRRAFLVALLFLAIPPASAQDTCATSVANIDFADDETSGCVDLRSAAGGTITVTVTDEAMGSDDTGFVRLQMACDCPLRQETIVESLQRVAGTDRWRYALDVDDPRLVTGEWVMQLDGNTADNSQTLSSGEFTLNVVADDSTKPRMRVLNVDDESGQVFVGKNQEVTVTVDDPLLRKVERTINDVGPFACAAPCKVSASFFQPAGAHTMRVTAEDRAGNTAEITFFVYADADDPDVAHDLPTRLFANVTNHLPLTVTDTSSVTATARIGQATGTDEGSSGTLVLDPAIRPTELGTHLLEITVEDVVGNQVRLVRSVEVVPLEVDLQLVRVRQVDDGAIPGEQMEVEITAQQGGGIVAIDADVVFQGETLGTVRIDADDETTSTLRFSLSSGLHNGILSILPPEGVRETAPADNARNVTLEQFLARVIFRDEQYHIRATPQGLPSEAVGPDGTTYSLALEDRGLTTVYAFEVDGFELFWNPESTTTTVPDPQEQEEEPDNGIPAPPVVWLLAALGAVLWLRRR